MVDLLSFPASIGIILSRVVPGIILLAAGVVKVRFGFNRFLAAITGYDLLPPYAARFLSYTLPIVEIVVGIMLIIGLLTEGFSLIGFTLFLFFSIAITINLMRGKKNACGCNNVNKLIDWHLVYRNELLMAFLLASYHFDSVLALDRWQFRTLIGFGSLAKPPIISLIVIWVTMIIVTMVLHFTSSRFLRR
jgi:uncharacterized membrane protein YphA (DoxX/SURF4 family)